MTRRYDGQGDGLLGRHVAFLEALRGAGLPVSLAEDLDAVAALSVADWDRRTTVRDVYAATLVKRQVHRAAFESLFDVYFPRLVGDGAAAWLGAPDAGAQDTGSGDDGPSDNGPNDNGPRDTAAALEAFREELAAAIVDDDEAALQRLAAQMVGQFGAMPGRAPGLSSWSAYTALQRVAPGELVDRLIAALSGAGRADEEIERDVHRRVGAVTAMVEADARRRIAEEKGPGHVAAVALRPSIDRLDFTSARRVELEQMRREIYPLARRLATRLSRQQAGRRAGPLDFRRTVRASMATGGVPITTVSRPRRPHRNELVVLCDVSGSVAGFATFTLLLMMAMREAFGAVRAFTFVDQAHEVTDLMRPGADPADVVADLAASAEHAARFGRTNYGRALSDFAERHGDALTPRTTLLVLGDARSNHADPGRDTLRAMAGSVRHAWWLNPEASRNWDTGDSVAGLYGDIVAMVECRNLWQLEAFVTGRL